MFQSFETNCSAGIHKPRLRLKFSANRQGECDCNAVKSFYTFSSHPVSTKMKIIAMITAKETFSKGNRIFMNNRSVLLTLF